VTKEALTQEITKRLGDPTGVAFGDRAVSYFVETVLELYASLTQPELINMTVSDLGYADTDISGNAYPLPSLQSRWANILAVNISGTPATPVDAKEYTMMLKNSMYSPGVGEYYYYFDGKQLVLLTGDRSTQILYEVKCLVEPMGIMDAIGSADEVPFPSTLIIKAIPEAVSKLKAEVGLMI